MRRDLEGLPVVSLRCRLLDCGINPEFKTRLLTSRAAPGTCLRLTWKPDGGTPHWRARKHVGEHGAQWVPRLLSSRVAVMRPRGLSVGRRPSPPWERDQKGAAGELRARLPVNVFRRWSLDVKGARLSPAHPSSGSGDRDSRRM